MKAPETKRNTIRVAAAAAMVVGMSGIASGQEEGDIRLADGADASQGTVEVFYRQHWGLVCDDGWDIQDAHVACRQVGFIGATRATENNEFGTNHSGQQRWLDDLRCTGTELRLTECWRPRRIGSTNCGRFEAAGAVCEGSVDDVVDLVSSKSALGLEEGGTTGESYTLKLDGEPDEDITVTVRPESGSGISVTPTTLTFTTENWETAQTVTATVEEGTGATSGGDGIKSGTRQPATPGPGRG